MGHAVFDALYGACTPFIFWKTILSTLVDQKKTVTQIKLGIFHVMLVD